MSNTPGKEVELTQPLLSNDKQTHDETKAANVSSKRIVNFDAHELEKHQLDYCDNSIITSKYTWYSFFPKNMWLQL
jgi:hypothetical protein